MTLEEKDVTRHREITCKAVSAIILLTLKWFKVSRKNTPFKLNDVMHHTVSEDVMKFHHLGLLLLDSNCLLLILKMFGLQEVSTLITSSCDSPDHK